MQLEDRHNELSEEFDRLTSRLKSMNQTDPEYASIWNQRADIKREMNELERSITG
jgi:hypothetical protein